jgi:hypothetical protein
MVLFTRFYTIFYIYKLHLMQADNVCSSLLLENVVLVEHPVLPNPVQVAEGKVSEENGQESIRDIGGSVSLLYVLEWKLHGFSVINFEF